MKVLKQRRTLAVFLSMMMVLLTIVSFMPLKASALNTSVNEVNVSALYDSGCLKTMTVGFQASGNFAAAYGKIGIQSQPTDMDYENPYLPSENAQSPSDWPTNVNRGGFISFGKGDEFLWTDCALHTVTVEFDDGVVNLSNNADYYIYLWTRSPSYGIYPDALLRTLKVQDGKLLDEEGNTIADATEYTITLKYQDDGATADSSLTTSNGKLANLPEPTRDGFTFKGWFDAETGGNQVTTETAFSENDTIYAQWEDNSAPATPVVYSTGFAYDCSRSPSFPQKGSSVTLRGFKGPIINDGDSSNVGTSQGNWKLIKKGTYAESYEEGHRSTLKSLLETTASNFSTDYTNIDVYELCNGDTHICYGVLSAFLSKGYFFIGTTWSGGAGYFLSKEACSGTISEEVTGDPTSPAEETPHEHAFGQWSIVKKATTTEAGLLERVCSCGFKEEKVIPMLTDKENDPDSGNVIDNTPASNVGGASLDDIEAAAESIPLEPEEYIAMLDGEDLKIYLNVIDVTDASGTMSDEDKALIREKISSVNNMKQGMLIDVSLLKKIGNGPSINVTETNAPIQITLKIPESLINISNKTARTYYIIRVHNGYVDVINGSFNSATGEFTFFTDKFSSYAIAYIDSPTAASASNAASGHTHVYNQEFDETEHWKRCSCGSIIKKSEHTFGAWKIIKESTETEDGVKKRTCTVCGYSETVSTADASTGEGAVIENDIIDMTEKDLTLAITFAISAAVIGIAIIDRRKVRK